YLFLACLFAVALSASAQKSNETDNTIKANYQLASKFSPSKLKKMIFSTEVKPKWINFSDKFWYAYTTSEGKKWYIVDPQRKEKKELFDHAKMAAEVTKIVKNPFDAQHLAIENLYFVRDNDNVFRFEVKSTKDTLKNKEEIKKLTNKKDTLKKKTFHFEYDMLSKDLREVSDTIKEKPIPSWATFNSDTSRVYFAKNYNLYWMDYA